MSDKLLSTMIGLLRPVSNIFSKSGFRDSPMAYSGRRYPRVIKVEASFDNAATAEGQGSREVGTDGIFVAESVSFSWEVTDTGNFGGTAPTGRIFPASALPPLVLGGSTAASAAADKQVDEVILDLLAEIPEFEIRVEQATSGRYWTPTAVPVGSLVDWHTGRWDLGGGYLLPPSERLTVQAKPMVACPHAGKLVTLFHGHVILGARMREEG